MLEIYGPLVDKHFQNIQGYPYFNTPKGQSKAGGSGTTNVTQKKQNDAGATSEAAPTNAAATAGGPQQPISYGQAAFGATEIYQNRLLDFLQRTAQESVWSRLF
jgi:hypothetical protein